jgi:hypothetical protein
MLVLDPDLAIKNLIIQCASVLISRLQYGFPETWHFFFAVSLSIYGLKFCASITFISGDMCSC